MRRLGLVLLLAGCRYGGLCAVVNTHLGFAHLTPGVNTYTVAALRRQVTNADLPILLRMLHDRSHVVRLAAMDVLAEMEPDGKKALMEVSRQLKADRGRDPELYLDIQNTLREPY